VVGAGLAGIAAALDLAEAGWGVTLWEASGKAGGRCRSYRDEVLGRRIDNGNHLILSGNAAVLHHARRVGAGHLLETRGEAVFPFADLDGEGFSIRVPATPLGGWRRSARPPGVGVGALAGVATLLAAGAGRTVAEAVRDRGAMWRAFWVPFTTAVLNTPPEAASAALLRAVLLRTFLRGAGACRPVLAPEGLGAALIDPALARLGALGVEVRLRAPLQRLVLGNGRAVALDVGGEEVALGEGDAVVLAVPPAALGAVLPDVDLPGPGPAILNAHFVVAAEVAALCPPVLGLLGSSAQWAFRRGDVVSVTVSAAEGLPVWGMAREDALLLLWSEVARALGTGARPVASRLIRERGATFDQSPAGAARRPATRTALRNVVLAGDHVATGLPATLEGAVRSGRMAAQALGRTLQ
jgi:squalene-associated FAD-dependent desaturase